MGSERDDEAFLQTLASRLDQDKLAQAQLMENSAQTMFGSDHSDNLVKWQLDIKEELERIEHLLKGHIPKRDPNGSEYYTEPDDKDRLFNEKGVKEILKLLSWYLNKNIILSNFSENQINQRIHQFSLYLTDFIFNNYQDFGLDDKEKIKHFPLIVMNIVNTVEAAYNRALNGGERESLRTARTVYQTEPINGMGMGFGGGGGGMALPQHSKTKWWNPSNWAR